MQTVKLFFSPAFYRFAAVCAMLSAATTLVVHLVAANIPPGFEERLQLANSAEYAFRLWVTLLHCWLVLFSMLGIAAARLGSHAGWMLAGLFAFFVFSFTELTRTSIVLHGLNNTWRAAYLNATDPAQLAAIKTMIDGWPGFNAGYFQLFYFAFGLGNVLYGLVLRQGKGLENAVGWVLLVWGTLVLYGFAGANFFKWLPALPDFFNYTYQPAVRVLAGVWLWHNARKF